MPDAEQIATFGHVTVIKTKHNSERVYRVVCVRCDEDKRSMYRTEKMAIAIASLHNKMHDDYDFLQLGQLHT